MLSVPSWCAGRNCRTGARPRRPASSWRALTACQTPLWHGSSVFRPRRWASGVGLSPRSGWPGLRTPAGSAGRRPTWSWTMLSGGAARGGRHRGPTGAAGLADRPGSGGADSGGDGCVHRGRDRDPYVGRHRAPTELAQQPDPPLKAMSDVLVRADARRWSWPVRGTSIPRSGPPSPPRGPAVRRSTVCPFTRACGAGHRCRVARGHRRGRGREERSSGARRPVLQVEGRDGDVQLRSADA